ncbi:MAG: hypothetical protein AB7P97_21625 [Hyphomonadaceae bacterium]
MRQKKAYQCSLLGKDGVITLVELSAENDADAIVQGNSFEIDSSHFQGLEIRVEARLVYSRRATAAIGLSAMAPPSSVHVR